MISSKILVPTIVVLACIIGLLMGTNLAVDAEQTMTYVGVAFLIFVLMARAREYWWFALFVAIGFGGYLYFGFKIYAHEVLLAIALAGLLPSIALHPYSDFARSRPRLPWFFYVLFGYLLCHIIYSILFHGARGYIEIGNIARAYTNGLWPLLFVFFFRFYGRSDYVPAALYLLQSVYVLRAVLTLSSTFLPSSMMLPGINFVLPGHSMNAGGLDDLRFSGHGICLLSCAILLGEKRLHMKALQSLLLVFGFVAVLASGGRLMLVASILIFVVALILARHWKTVILVGGLSATAIVLLNLFPQLTHDLDWRTQRALSILIFDTGATDARHHVEGSNVWHEGLSEIGYERWTSSLQTFLIGTGIKPWDATIFREASWDRMFQALMEGAADTGNYESGLWAILAPTGVVGFLLYLSVLGYFAGRNGMFVLKGNPVGWKLTIAFLGSYPALEWLMFSFRAGSYPAIELILACTAFYYLKDRETEITVNEDSAADASVYSE